MKWACGITSIPTRQHSLFEQTAKSLYAAGFDSTRLFIDDAQPDERDCGQQITTRWPKIGPLGNWVLGLWELYLRNPEADRYAMFQDDLLICKNTRQYLERIAFPDRGYWNLFTTHHNQELATEERGFYLSNQMGRGALALVFSRDCLLTLFRQKYFLTQPQRMNRNIDGMVSEALRAVDYKEYVHNPSLVYHTGEVSTMEHLFPDSYIQPNAISFPGESFDAMECLKCTAKSA
jgi:hypothetical protein